MNRNERIEHDALGEMRVPAEHLWGPQTQRSLQNFPIGTEKMPTGILHALAQIKSAAATVNHQLGRLTEAQMRAIQTACQAILAGELADEFPLSVWQTGSGTQTNMNLNEVIARYGQTLLEQAGQGDQPLHPNDQVNCSQSSNDTFPTAMHLAALQALHEQVFPALDALIATLKGLEDRHQHLLKIGRTHLQDAVPLTFGQEVSGWRYSFEQNLAQLQATLPYLESIALGATAVGTGLNAPAGFAEAVTQQLAKQTGWPLKSSENKFHALANKDEFAFAHGALRSLAANLLKLANDLRWLASGPRAGLGELALPENEPGSSIMPGKVNPTQCEAATQVAVRVFGNDTTIQIAASQGNFQLNVYLPVMIDSYLQSARLLADAMNSLRLRCLEGLTPRTDRMAENLNRSLMLVTALNPHIGYERAAKIARLAHEQDLTLKQAALALGEISEADFDRWVNPQEMV